MLHSNFKRLHELFLNMCNLSLLAVNIVIGFKATIFIKVS